MTTRTCVACGSPITVTTRNPNRRFCSPRCRAAEWHARNRTNDVVNGANDAADAVHTPDAVHNAVRAANGTARCPHCRHELAVIIPADAAHVQTPEVITQRYPEHARVVTFDEQHWSFSMSVSNIQQGAAIGPAGAALPAR